MIKRLQLAVAAILLAALAVYGYTERPKAQSQAADSRIALERHEAAVIKALNLSAKQKSDYDALQKRVKSEWQKAQSLPNPPARGAEINSMLHAGLQKIFSSAQYKKYIQMWAPTDLTEGQAPMATGTPFGGTDELILNQLKLTPSQWDQYRAFQREREIRTEEYKALFKQDANKGAIFGNDLNRWTRSEMYRILGEDKYYEWIRLWDQVMAPYVANGAKLQGRVARPIDSNGAVSGPEFRPLGGRAGG